MPERPVPPGTPGRTLGVTTRSVRGAVSVAAGLGLLLVVVPHLAGATWAAIGAALGAVPVRALVALGVLWLSGLLAHTLTLTAAMPPLTHRRALTLSLTGSAVANVLPFGGAAGVALNYRMSRAWGFEPGAFAVYTIVTNVWDVLARLSLPVLALAWLALGASALPSQALAVAATATGGLALVAVAGAAVVWSPGAAQRVGTLVDRGLTAVLRFVGSARTPRVAQLLPQLRRDSAAVVRGGWPRLTLGVVAYAVLTAALMGACLQITGAGLAPSAVFAGFALERVLSLVGLTPGGAGLVEVGVTGLLIALGGEPVGTVTGVLLYRVFTCALEIPVGGAGIAGWWWAQHRLGGRGGVGEART